MGSMDGAVRAGERVAAEIDVFLGDKVAPIA
jgi:monoamine oxidase